MDRKLDRMFEELEKNAGIGDWIHDKTTNMIGDILATEGGQKFLINYLQKSKPDPSFAGEVISTPGGQKAVSTFLKEPKNRDYVSDVVYSAGKKAVVDAKDSVVDWVKENPGKTTLMAIAPFLSYLAYKKLSKPDPVQETSEFEEDYKNPEVRNAVIRKYMAAQQMNRNSNA